MARRKKTMAALVALALAAAACSEATDDGTSTTLGSDTNTTAVGEATTTMPATSTTDGETGEATGGTMTAAQLEELERQADELATLSADIQALGAAWTDLEAKFQTLSSEVADDEVVIDQEMMVELATDLEEIDSLVEENSTELGTEFQTQWDAFRAEFESFLGVAS